jgi:hypothetical protein
MVEHSLTIILVVEEFGALATKDALAGKLLKSVQEISFL